MRFRLALSAVFLAGLVNPFPGCSAEASRAVHKHFTPDRHPGPARAKEILGIEHGIWGGPSAYARIDCETGGTWRWNATNPNGIYKGFGQIGPWWWFAYPQTPRKVRFVTHRKTKQGDVKYVHTGWLPKGADQYHGWANIRVTQRALSGDGPSTGWDC